MSGEHQSEGLKVVEFFGVPGVGKSYLVRTAVSANIARPMDRFSQGGRVQRFRRKVWLMLRHLPKAVSSTLWARKLISLYPAMGSRRWWKVLFNWVFLDCLIREAARCRTPVLVLDQGIAQALWSTQFGAGGRCPTEEVRTPLRRYLEGLPISEWAVVRVTAPPEIVKKRVEGREGFSPVDRDPGSMDEARCAERQVGEVLTGLARGAEGAPSIRIVNLVNDDDRAVSRLREVMGWT